MTSIIRCTSALLLMVVSLLTLSAQTVSNVTAEQVGKTIHVSYELDKAADITLHLSMDGGKTYQKLNQVSGDVGDNVTSSLKTIVWDVLEERERLVGDNIVFKVKAQGGGNLEFKVKGVTFKMIYVRGDSFTMGCTGEQGRDCYDSETPAHSVTSSDFYMGETEVTQALWKAVMGSNPSYYKGDDLPVERVSWNDCQEFIRKLNSLTGKTFRLSTETEWEFAARGGIHHSGYKYAGGNSVEDVAWYEGNSSSQTHPVGSKQPNALGLYDMSGNVWEWCSDWYGSYSGVTQTNLQDSSSGPFRVFRGGSWFNLARICRVSYRSRSNPNHRDSDIGLRLVLVP